MWCGPTDGKFLNRDLNDALNIRRCLALSVWQVAFCRVAIQGRSREVVGKVIRCGREKRMPVAIVITRQPNGLVPALGCL